MALPLMFAALLAAPAFALDTGDIVIVSVRGEVHVAMKGAERAARAGTVLELPATLRTGVDGGAELRQGSTSVSVGPDTLLEFPALATRGGPIDRIVQPRGNAFYDIGKREGRKLRVETPFLVGVVKGTQFNVAVQADVTTISLFEGALDVRSDDTGVAIDLKAGEIASRRRGGTDIGVMKMDAGKAPALPRTPSGAGGTNQVPAPAPVPARPAPSNIEGEPVYAERGEAVRPVVAGPVAEVIAAAPIDTGEIAGTVDVAAGTSGGAMTVDAAPPASVDVGVDAAVAVEPTPAATSDVAVGVDVGTGTANVDLGAAAGVDVEPVAAVDVKDNNGLALGHDKDNPGLALGHDKDNPGLALGHDDAVQVETAVADVGAAASVDLSADSGAAATVDLGVSVGDVDLGVEVDLGLDDDDDDSSNSGSGNSGSSGSSNSGQGSSNSGPGNAQDVTELLDSLLRKPKKK